MVCIPSLPLVLSCADDGEYCIRSEMIAAERIDYTSAVVCLHHKPAQLPSAEFPGVKSRLDDFVACVYD